MPFTFQKLAIADIVLIDPPVAGDGRGFLMETYKRSEFAAAGIAEVFVQENHSSSARAVLRGLHYQAAPHAQSKLIRVVRGEIFDVAVDIRHDSPTARQWIGVTLSSENRRMIYLPDWCAHGFCVLSDTAEVAYMTSAEYAPTHDSGIMWNDPAFAIEWPLSSPILSERDTKWPPFAVSSRT